MQLRPRLETILPSERIKTRTIDLLAHAGDASFYHLVPKAVVLPETLDEIRALFALSQQDQIPLTFRAAGTSLNGQAVTDGILVDISRYWRDIRVEENGARVRVQPGVIGGYVNAVLKKFGAKIGPDPASINAAMMGGILANNSSGMCCGVVQNAYHTLRYLTVMLPNGLCFNTERPEDYQRFEQEAAPVAQTLLALRRRVLDNPTLAERIRQKYRIKNTVGYGLNALLDHEHPLDILAHLMIGSEGTLGFIAEAVLDTVPDYPCKTTGLVHFSSVRAACDAIEPLTRSGARALELMDWNSILAIRDLEGAPADLHALPTGAATLLVEYQEATPEDLAKTFAAATPILNGCAPGTAAAFTEAPAHQAALWKLRKGLYPSVAAVRKSGASVLVEDLTFPVPRLGEAGEDLQRLMEQHGYHNGMVLGHAKDGNLHFVVSQLLNTPEEVARYGRFMDDIAALTLQKYDGALKGEHGTGRNMAPFVEAEWGGEAYAIMCEIKQTLDPDNLLNPGVLINPDPEAHLKHLKQMPTVEAEVDKCVECGFCENRCPSRDLTLTPRRRIALRRAIVRLREDKDPRLDEVLRDYQYDALDTCAVDGLCATDCPVDINTGELVKRLRRENLSPGANRWALWVACHPVLTEQTLRLSLQAGFVFNTVLGSKAMPRLTAALRGAFKGFPLWSRSLARPAAALPHPAATDAPAVVYFTACVSRLMGGDTPAAFRQVAEKAGFRVIPVPSGTCCGQAFSSKGFAAAAQHTHNATVERLWALSESGRWPIFLDASSCTQTLRGCRAYLTADNQQRFDALRLLDSVEFLHDLALPRLAIAEPLPEVVLHPVCSLQKMKLYEKNLALARACAQKVTIPAGAGCCGMAGDRGFLVPELSASALREEAQQVAQTPTAEGHFTSACTCAQALQDATGQPYGSMAHLVLRAMEGG